MGVSTDQSPTLALVFFCLLLSKHDIQISDASNSQTKPSSIFIPLWICAWRTISQIPTCSVRNEDPQLFLKEMLPNKPLFCKHLRPLSEEGSICHASHMDHETFEGHSKMIHHKTLLQSTQNIFETSMSSSERQEFVWQRHSSILTCMRVTSSEICKIRWSVSKHAGR